MASTFGTLGIALSALQYNRAGLDVAAGNIANAGTDGYSRRVLIGQSSGITGTTALWSRSDQAGSGVEIGAIARTVDQMLNARSRIENGRLGQLEVRGYVLDRMETGLAEPGELGLQSKLSSMFSSWAVLGENPSDDAARQEVLSAAAATATQLNSLDRGLVTEWTLQRTGMEQSVDTINGAAVGIAKLNDAIRVATATGADANDLLDQRDALLGDLGRLAGATAVNNADGTVDVRIGGQVLVSGAALPSGSFVRELRVVGATTLDGAAADPIQVAIGEEVGGVFTGATVTGFTGTLGGQSEAVSTVLPDLRERIDAIAAEVAATVNAVHASGYDPNGDLGLDVFTGRPDGTVTAASIAVNPVVVADLDKLAANATSGSLDGGVAAQLGALATVQGSVLDSYRSFVSGLASDAASTNQTWLTQETLTSSVDASRMSISGVDTDEEMVLLVSHQRGYEAAAKVMATLDSILDTLINRMGVG